MSSPILYDQPLSAIAGSDGIAFDVTTPRTGVLVAANTAKVSFVGTSSWGQPNTRIVITSPRDQLQLIGPQKVGTYDLGTVVNLALSSGLSNVSVVRVVDTTQTSA